MWCPLDIGCCVCSYNLIEVWLSFALTNLSFIPWIKTWIEIHRSCDSTPEKLKSYPGKQKPGITIYQTLWLLSKTMYQNKANQKMRERGVDWISTRVFEGLFRCQVVIIHRTLAVIQFQWFFTRKFVDENSKMVWKIWFL